MANLREILAAEGLITAAGTPTVKVKTSKGTMVFELTAQQAAALKAMPKGKSFEYDVSHTGDELNGGSWKKDRGHPDAIRSRFWKAIKAAGFREFKNNSRGSPDGNYVGDDTYLKDSEGNVITWSETYGPTAAYNRFRADLTFKKPASVSAASLSQAEQRDKVAEWAEEVLKGLVPFKRVYILNRRGVVEFSLPDELLPSWATKDWGYGRFQLDLTSGAFSVEAGKEMHEGRDLEVSFSDSVDLLDTRSFLAALDRLVKEVKRSKKPRR